MTNWARVLILVFTIAEAGWLAFDGTWALVVGDFITPKSGPYAVIGVNLILDLGGRPAVISAHEA